MKRLLVLLIILVVSGVPAFALNLVQNGDFEATTGGQPNAWTFWKAPWSTKSFAYSVLTSTDTTAPSSWPTTGMLWPGMSPLSGGSAYLSSNNEFCAAWYQAITVTPGKQYKISAQWRNWGHGDGAAAYWFETMLFNDDSRAVGDQLDSPVAGAIVAKREVSGAAGSDWYNFHGWESVADHLTAPNSDIVTATGSTIYVAIKAGNSYGSAKRSRALWDNVVVEEVMVTPEPSSMLALATGLAGLGGLVIRRKR